MHPGAGEYAATDRGSAECGDESGWRKSARMADRTYAGAPSIRATACGILSVAFRRTEICGRTPDGSGNRAPEVDFTDHRRARGVAREIGAIAVQRRRQRP